MGGAKEILPKFLQICLNNFYSTKVLRKTFLLLLVHCVFLYHATIDLIEHLVFEIWFLKLPNLKKYARLCKNIVRSQSAQYLDQLPHDSEVWHSIHKEPAHPKPPVKIENKAYLCLPKARK